MREQLIQFGDRHLNYAMSSNDAPALVMLHGVTRRWQTFLPLWSSLAQRWQLSAIDFRGHGLSDNLNGRYLVCDYAEDVMAYLDSQFDRFSREKVYTSFAKACHSMYRFDSSDEARLAYLLDKDGVVEDWLRPAPNQFEGLFWRDAEGNSNHRYEPDFVVEMEKEIVMIEVKPSGGVNAVDVQEKKRVADKYCELVTENIGKFGITKTWRYIIVETESITATSTISVLLGKR